MGTWQAVILMAAAVGLCLDPRCACVWLGQLSGPFSASQDQDREKYMTSLTWRLQRCNLIHPHFHLYKMLLQFSSLIHQKRVFYQALFHQHSQVLLTEFLNIEQLEPSDPPFKAINNRSASCICLVVLLNLIKCSCLIQFCLCLRTHKAASFCRKVMIGWCDDAKTSILFLLTQHPQVFYPSHITAVCLCQHFLLIKE